MHVRNPRTGWLLLINPECLTWTYYYLISPACFINQIKMDRRRSICRISEKKKQLVLSNKTLTYAKDILSFFSLIAPSIAACLRTLIFWLSLDIFFAGFMVFNSSQLAKLKKEYSSHANAMEFIGTSTWSKTIPIIPKKIQFSWIWEVWAIYWKKKDILPITP